MVDDNTNEVQTPLRGNGIASENIADILSEYYLSIMTQQYIQKVKDNGLQSIWQCSSNLSTKAILEQYKSNIAICSMSFYIKITNMFDELKSIYTEQNLNHHFLRCLYEQKKAAFAQFLAIANIVIPRLILRTKRQINFIMRNSQILN